MRRLINIKACENYCVLVQENEVKKGEWVLVLSNAVGCPLDSKVINIEPRFVAMNKTHIIVCSEDAVYFWQYRSQYAQTVSLESEKSKAKEKENAFFIDEVPNQK